MKMAGYDIFKNLKKMWEKKRTVIGCAVIYFLLARCHSLWSPTEGGHVIGWALHHKLYHDNGEHCRDKKVLRLGMTQCDNIMWYDMKCESWQDKSSPWTLSSFIDYGGQALVTSQHHLGFRIFHNVCGISCVINLTVCFKTSDRKWQFVNHDTNAVNQWLGGG